MVDYQTVFGLKLHRVSRTQAQARNKEALVRNREAASASAWPLKGSAAAVKKKKTTGAADAGAPTKGGETRGELEGLTVAKLKERLKGMGRKVGGRKAELVERILEG